MASSSHIRSDAPSLNGLIDLVTEVEAYLDLYEAAAELALFHTDLLKDEFQPENTLVTGLKGVVRRRVRETCCPTRMRYMSVNAMPLGLDYHGPP